LVHAARTVYLPGPVRTNQKLAIHGWVNPKMLANGPIHLALTVAGIQQPVKTITKKISDFRFEYDVPADLIGCEKIELSLAVDRSTQVPPDPRDLALAFGQISIH